MAPKKLSDKSRAKLNEALEDSLHTKVIKAVYEHNVLWDNRLDGLRTFVSSQSLRNSNAAAKISIVFTAKEAIEIY